MPGGNDDVNYVTWRTGLEECLVHDGDVTKWPKHSAEFATSIPNMVWAMSSQETAWCVSF